MSSHFSPTFLWKKLMKLLLIICLEAVCTLIIEPLMSLQHFYIIWLRTAFFVQCVLCIHEQTDRIGMGSPLRPLFADYFLLWHETNWLNNCPSNFKPVFYHHHGDDCFLLFNSSDHVKPFLHYQPFTGW